MKLLSLVCLATLSAASSIDSDFDLPPLTDREKSALSAFQDKKAFAEAWKQAAHDLHERYEKIREKHHDGPKHGHHHKKIRKVVYVDDDSQ